jgi:hypothetical protein
MNSMSQTTDNKLKEIFQSWGDEPPRNAWDSISKIRQQRALEKRKKRRKVFLAFFSGSLLMALILLPFILFKNQPATDSTSNQASTGTHDKHDHNSFNNHTSPKYTSPSLGETSSPAFSETNKANQQQPYNKKNALADIHPHHVFSQDHSTHAGQNLVHHDDEDGQKISMILLKTRPHAYDFLTEFGKTPGKINFPHLPGNTLPGWMLTLELGRVGESTRIDKFTEAGGAHKDAGKNYGEWLATGKSGVTLSAEINRSFKYGWQVQSGFNYVNSEQKVHYDYTLRDIPVFWNGRIVGYIPLNDTQASVYKMDQVNKVQRLNVSLSVGKQILHFGRWRISAFATASTNLVNGDKGSILNLNKNTFENIGGLMKNKNIPLGYSLRCSYGLPKGMVMFMQYARMNSKQSIHISGADIITSNISNKIILGIQYPIIKK